jgi:hypothetical protein
VLWKSIATSRTREPEIQQSMPKKLLFDLSNLNGIVRRTPRLVNVDSVFQYPGNGTISPVSAKQAGDGAKIPHIGSFLEEVLFDASLSGF